MSQGRAITPKGCPRDEQGRADSQDDRLCERHHRCGVSPSPANTQYVALRERQERIRSEKGSARAHQGRSRLRQGWPGTWKGPRADPSPPSRLQHDPNRSTQSRQCTKLIATAGVIDAFVPPQPVITRVSRVLRVLVASTSSASSQLRVGLYSHAASPFVELPGYARPRKPCAVPYTLTSCTFALLEKVCRPFKCMRRMRPLGIQRSVCVLSVNVVVYASLPLPSLGLSPNWSYRPDGNDCCTPRPMARNQLSLYCVSPSRSDCSRR